MSTEVAENPGHKLLMVLWNSLIHLLDQRVDLVFPVPQITALHKVLELPRPETSCRVAQLEWPQEVASLLEVGSDGEDLVDQVLHTDDSVLAQVVLDESVVSQRDALLLDLAVSALVDQFTDGLQVGVSIGDIGLDHLEHFQRSFCQANKDTVVDLKESEELKDFAWLGSNLVDTVQDSMSVLVDSCRLSTNTHPLIRTTKTSLGSAGT